MNRPPKMPKVLGALSSIIEVDGGRGFIVERQKNRFVLTAAHCLPHLPPCSLMSQGEERTYKHLLGVIGQHAKVWAQCLLLIRYPILPFSEVRTIKPFSSNRISGKRSFSAQTYSDSSAATRRNHLYAQSARGVRLGRDSLCQRAISKH